MVCVDSEIDVKSGLETFIEAVEASTDISAVDVKYFRLTLTFENGNKGKCPGAVGGYPKGRHCFTAEVVEM